ncbi:hypothetical protein CLV84_2212 [Neolewinella xylanilytica]|uniref:Uncharacterized protein n=1 Tax=Neolewinella xylanilytica TaxID=1514080 RepID=A0A2S6I2B3_9BACT|nr:hypothetical protein [Neolewinella xylanilytica]PPK85317.1 hypothetical protein CLV84_2212 [Neolewinella xylanilytica]
MTRDDLITYLHRLSQNLHPLTGGSVGKGGCLNEPAIRAELIRLVDRLQQMEEAVLPAEEITGIIADLRELDYKPTPTQVAKVLTGSRSVADPRLRGLPAYRRYRGVVSQRDIRRMLASRPDLFTELSGEKEYEAIPATVADWQAVDFFTEGYFDKLESDKAASLTREVTDLGLRKATERLPAYMARARQRLPRAFEPWTKEERALLIEAMCYTNDLDKLTGIFGRSAASLEREGKQLIWNSRKPVAA